MKEFKNKIDIRDIYQYNDEYSKLTLFQNCLNYFKLKDNKFAMCDYKIETLKARLMQQCIFGNNVGKVLQDIDIIDKVILEEKPLI